MHPTPYLRPSFTIRRTIWDATLLTSEPRYACASSRTIRSGRCLPPCGRPRAQNSASYTIRNSAPTSIKRTCDGIPDRSSTLTRLSPPSHPEINSSRSAATVPSRVGAHSPGVNRNANRGSLSLVASAFTCARMPIASGFHCTRSAGGPVCFTVRHKGGTTRSASPFSTGAPFSSSTYAICFSSAAVPGLGTTVVHSRSCNRNQSSRMLNGTGVSTVNVELETPLNCLFPITSRFICRIMSATIAADRASIGPNARGSSSSNVKAQ